MSSFLATRPSGCTAGSRSRGGGGPLPALTALSYDELRGKDELAVNVIWLIVDFVEKEIGRPFTDELPWLSDGRERDAGLGGEVDVVEANDGDVLGNAEPVCYEGLQ